MPSADRTTLWFEFSMGVVTQGGSFLATLGLWDAIPLGLTCPAHQHAKPLRRGRYVSKPRVAVARRLPWEDDQPKHEPQRGSVLVAAENWIPIGNPRCV